MSVGPLGGTIVSIAGTPLAQTKGGEVDRAQQETTAQKRQATSLEKAEAAAGIGETDGEDHEAEDRDADGRRPWEIVAEAKQASEQGQPVAPSQSKDTTGASGRLLDLTG
ncbi:MAG: hypothetical protein ACOY3P_22515 [Planctomycetota bacterium]